MRNHHLALPDASSTPLGPTATRSPSAVRGLWASSSTKPRENTDNQANTTRRESMCFADEMDINLRAGISADAADCGRICHEAFSTIASRHGYTSLFPTLEHGTGLMSALLSSANFYTVVAEVDGRVVGSGVLQEWDKLAAGIIVIGVDPNSRAAGSVSA